MKNPVKRETIQNEFLYIPNEHSHLVLGLYSIFLFFFVEYLENSLTIIVNYRTFAIFL